MAGYHMYFGPQQNLEEIDHSKQKFEVRYTTPNLGFIVTKEVTDEMQRMLKIAVECGKEQMKKEIHDLLRLK